MPALASTQLSAAITANQTIFGIGTVTTPTGSVGFPPVGVYANPQQPLMIDGEIMYLVIQNPAGTLQVRSRGAEGTVASAHDILANVYTGTPSVMKIDVEGHEMDVLKGADETIRKHKPALIVEIHNLDESPIPDYLANLGYTKMIPRIHANYLFVCPN